MPWGGGRLRGGGRQVPPVHLGSRAQPRCSGRAWGHPGVLRGSGAERAVSVSWLSSPLEAVAPWPCSFLSSSPAVGNFSPPSRLLRKLLSLSPQVIFHHVALKSWALLGGEEGGTGPTDSFLRGEGGPGDFFPGQEGNQTFPRGHLSTDRWWLLASLGRG